MSLWKHTHTHTRLKVIVACWTFTIHPEKDFRTSNPSRVIFNYFFPSQTTNSKQQASYCINPKQQSHKRRAGFAFRQMRIPEPVSFHQNVTKKPSLKVSNEAGEQQEGTSNHHQSHVSSHFIKGFIVLFSRIRTPFWNPDAISHQASAKTCAQLQAITGFFLWNFSLRRC